MRGFVVDLGQTVKRPLSDREIAAVGEVLSSVGLLRDRRKRKRLLRRVREKARSVEIGLKRRNRTTPGQTMLSRNRPWNWTKEEDERLKAFVAQGAFGRQSGSRSSNARLSASECAPVRSAVHSAPSRSPLCGGGHGACGSAPRPRPSGRKRASRLHRQLRDSRPPRYPLPGPQRYSEG